MENKVIRHAISYLFYTFIYSGGCYFEENKEKYSVLNAVGSSLLIYCMLYLLKRIRCKKIIISIFT